MNDQRVDMPRSASPISYRLGSLYATITAFLYATQEPFSFLAAKHLNTMQFVLLTQIALFISIPLVTAHSGSRGDLVRLLGDRSNYPKLAVIFAIGMSGLLLYNFGLSNAHPIIISAILNLTPFWAVGVALILSRVPIPVSPTVFFSCFAGAFIGAMAVAWSQIGDANRPSIEELADNIRHGSWVYAIPVPLCSALGGTLVGKWLAKYDESAAVAANFLFANVLLIPATVFLLYRRSELQFDNQWTAIILMILGTIIASSVGRVFYQISLTVTGADNGFVTMFWNLVPALTALVSLAMSWWIADLHFAADPMFFLGLALIAASLLIFSLKSWRQPQRPS
jgi:drug/metabolite transporter (DMT)-like permease